MDSEPARPDLPEPDGPELRELRRSYHDRIAAVRGETTALVSDSVRALGEATAALLEGDTGKGEAVAAEVSAAPARVAAIESEVLSLLALQAPVARDLRVILAARDIAHVAELCLGLCHTLANRVQRIDDVLTPELRDLLGAVGQDTAALLAQANGAWITLDPDQASLVAVTSDRSRQLQQKFFAEVVGLRLVPVDAAVDLGMAMRVFERLTDHALDIARRVGFAVSGSPG